MKYRSISNFNRYIEVKEKAQKNQEESFPRSSLLLVLRFDHPLLSPRSIPPVSGGAGIVVAAFQSRACAAIAARKRPVLHQLSRPNGWPRQPLRLTAFFPLSLSLSPFSLSLSLSLLVLLSSTLSIRRPRGLPRNYKVEGSGFDNKDLTTAGRKDETHRHPRRLPIGRARFLR